MSPQDVLRLFVTKPRIRRDRADPTGWCCEGSGFKAYGLTPSSAYRAWRIERDAALWRREFAKPSRPGADYWPPRFTAH